MRGITLAIVASVIVAGCVGGESEAVEETAPEGADAAAPTEAGTNEPGTDPEQPETTTAPPQTEQDTGSKSLYFEDTFQLTVSHVAAPGAGRFNLDPNCVSFGKDQVWLILNGTMEATWSASSLFAEKMTLDVRDIGLMATNNGSASPAVLEFGRFQTVPNALLGLLFTVQPTDPGVVYGQTVTLRIAFNYFGERDLETEVVPCVYNTAFEDDDERASPESGGFS